MESGTEIVKKIKPVQFEYDYSSFELNDKKCFGVIAQDLEKIFPMDEFSIVQKKPNGFLAVDYVQLIPHLIKAVQQLTEKIERMEAEK